MAESDGEPDCPDGDGGAAPKEVFEDGLPDLCDLEDLLDSWERRWEQEFKRFEEAEDEHLVRVAEGVSRLAAGLGSIAHQAAVEMAVEESDARARCQARLAAELDDAERRRDVARVRESAEQQRRSACGDAMQSAHDVANDVMERAAQRRAAREAREREERRRRQAESEAKWQRKRAEQAAAAAAAAGDAGAGADSASGAAGASSAGGYSAGGRQSSSSAGGGAAPPPRYTRVPGSGRAADAGAAGAAGAGASASEARSESGPPKLVTFEAFTAAWENFERRVSRLAAQRSAAPVAAAGAASSSSPLRCEDVPWPTSLPSVSGIEPRDSAEQRKRKLRQAVLRWHPDKWGPVLALVESSERPGVLERVKEVTRRILDERRRLGGA